MPEYYKTKKGYYYKKTQKGGSTRISKNNYEKAVKRQEGGFSLSIPNFRKSRQQNLRQNTNSQQTPEEIYKDIYNEKKTHGQKYYMRYNQPGVHKQFMDENYKWNDEFYKLNKSYEKYFNNLIVENNNDAYGSILRIDPNVKKMIFSRYLKIIQQSNNYDDFNNILNNDDLFKENQEYKKSLKIDTNKYNEIKSKLQ